MPGTLLLTVTLDQEPVLMGFPMVVKSESQLPFRKDFSHVEFEGLLVELVAPITVWKPNRAETIVGNE